MKALADANIKNKIVLLRVDFNVILKDGMVGEDFRIRAVLPVIRLLIEKGAKKIVMLSHLGRPNGEVNSELSLQPVARHLAKLLGAEVAFLTSPIGTSVKDEIARAKERFILLENLRFYRGEEINHQVFAKNLSELGDIFVQDAFGVCHREHASVVGVPAYIPSYVGPLIENEIHALNRLIKNPERPFTVLIGGAKISTKIGVIEKFLTLADSVCLGGALANTVLKARGMAVGLSLVEDSVLSKISQIQFTNLRLRLPIDVKVAKDLYAKDGFWAKGVGNVAPDEIILDIGPDTQDMFISIIRSSKTILWNGPLGYIENRQFAEGTLAIAKEVTQASKHAFTVVGGGDTYQTLEELGLMNRISFVSTGGGAALDYIVYETLPGIEALR